MKSTGIRRKVDDLGRIVIPAGVRRTLGIREGDALDVSVEGDKVILAKPQDRCVFCSTDLDLQDFEGKAMCRACVARVGVLDERLRLARQVQEREVADETGLPAWDEPSPSRPPAAGVDGGADARAAAPTDEDRNGQGSPAPSPGPSSTPAEDPASTTAW